MQLFCMKVFFGLSGTHIFSRRKPEFRRARQEWKRIFAFEGLTVCFMEGSYGYSEGGRVSWSTAAQGEDMAIRTASMVSLSGSVAIQSIAEAI